MLFDAYILEMEVIGMIFTPFKSIKCFHFSKKCKFGEDVEKLEIFYNVSGTIKWCYCFGKQY